jgi:hypothetical protein
MSDLVDQIFDDEYYPGSKKKKAAPVTLEFVSDPWRDNYVLKNMDGEEVRMYTIGSLADALGVSVPTVRAWTKNGYIPQAPFRLPSNMLVQGEKVAGRRLYTEALIDSLIHIFEKHNLLGQHRIVWKNHPEVPIEIFETWSRLTDNR